MRNRTLPRTAEILFGLPMLLIGLFGVGWNVITMFVGEFSFRRYDPGPELLAICVWSALLLYGWKLVFRPNAPKPPTSHS